MAPSLATVNGNREEKRRDIFERGLARQRMLMAARPARGGVGGNLLRTVSFDLWEGGHGGTCYRQRMSRTARPAGLSGPYNVRPGALKDRSREESACAKSAALIRRPAQDREQP